MNKFVIPDQQDFIYEIFSDGFIEELQPLMKRVTTTPRDFGNKVRLTITYLVDQILFSAIQLVLAGGQYLPHQLLDNEQDLDNAVHAAGSTSTLTPRQTDILECLSLGKTNKDIARQLHISPATVQTHINAIFRALAVTNRTQAVYVGGKLGLIRSQ